MTGVNEGNLRQYLLELMLAVVGGALAPPKFAVGLRACGVPPGEGTPLLLTDLLWCAHQHVNALTGVEKYSRVEGGLLLSWLRCG